jgi:hypothetical protein
MYGNQALRICRSGNNYFDSEYWQRIKDNERVETKKSKTYAYVQLF